MSQLDRMLQATLKQEEEEEGEELRQTTDLETGQGDVPSRVYGNSSGARTVGGASRSSLSAVPDGKLDRLKQQVSDTRAVILESIDLVVARGERLDALAEKTEEVAATAGQFRRTAGKAKAAWAPTGVVGECLAAAWVFAVDRPGAACCALVVFVLFVLWIFGLLS